jgi:hypothetical protein
MKSTSFCSRWPSLPIEISMLFSGDIGINPSGAGAPERALRDGSTTANSSCTTNRSPRF